MHLSYNNSRFLHYLSSLTCVMWKLVTGLITFILRPNFRRCDSVVSGTSSCHRKYPTSLVSRPEQTCQRVPSLHTVIKKLRYPDQRFRFTGERYKCDLSREDYIKLAALQMLELFFCAMPDTPPEIKISSPTADSPLQRNSFRFQVSTNKLTTKYFEYGI